ncbi:glycerate kinase type-2 family protein [Methylomonas sp. MgM2]
MSQATQPLREQCLSLFREGIAAADPAAAVKSHLQIEDGRLVIGGAPKDWKKIHILSFGKAACAMAKAARQIVPNNRLSEPGIVVTTYENLVSVEGFEVMGAGHPLPDANGLSAAQKIAAKLQQAGEGELVLALISGGGSALLPYPADGVSLDDKIAATRLLLGCGADIKQINCVRKHLSQIKGGGLARLAAPAELHALILSDVLGDDLSTIASGPTVADETTFADAIEVFKNKNVWDRLPASVQHYLRQGAEGLKAETPKPGDPLFDAVSNALIGSNSLSVDAVLNAAFQHRYRTEVYSRHLSGEARRVAERLLLYGKSLFNQGVQQNVAVIAGGETTVTLVGSGRGGRNQEMALAFALAADRNPLPYRWTFLSGGTDGRDGPTDAAGGLVDHQTLGKIRAAGIDPQTALDNNDSYTALKAANDLVITGATGTNVADLQILLLHPHSE